MLIPLDKDISLTTISLSTMDFFYKNQFKKKSTKSILYFSCVKNLLDDTKLIINKYFSNIIDTLDNVDFSEVIINSTEYFYLLNDIIDRCHKKKDLYELIVIEGINFNHSVSFEKINYDISQNLSAEVIFIANLKNNYIKHIEKKEKGIKFLFDKKQYKNILGVIFNKINTPFKEKKYNFIEKLTFLKEIKYKKEVIFSKELFKNNFFSIIACIPWNRKIITTYIIDIYNFLNIKNINLTQKKTDFIEEIIIFDESYLNMLNRNYSNTLIIVSFSRIDVFLNMFHMNFNSNNIKCVILTGALKSKKDIISVSKILIKRSISILYTEKNTLDLLSQLQNFNFNITVKNKVYIKKLQKYISSFFCYSSMISSKDNHTSYKKYSPKEFCYNLKILAKEKNKRIILPESYETRILKAAAICSDNKIAECVLLGDPHKIYRIANNEGINLSKNIEIMNPVLIRNNYIPRLLEIRQEKGMDEVSAKKKIQDNTVLATLILESDEVDGLVSGSINTTSDTIRPALQIIKTNPDNLLVSSIFFMLLPHEVLIYGDCAINVNPTAEELAEIAIQSADSLKMFGIEPRIAMLSYSTGYSGSGYQVEKVRIATSIIKNKRSDLIVDGPIQYDAAVSKTVMKLKAPYSPLSGSANIFIFPDLNSGNIAYKAVQRSANIISIGPMLQGLRKPVNDLSRGASVEDIIYTIALTSIQSK